MVATAGANEHEKFTALAERVGQIDFVFLLETVEELLTEFLRISERRFCVSFLQGKNVDLFPQSELKRGSSRCGQNGMSSSAPALLATKPLGTGLCDRPGWPLDGERLPESAGFALRSCIVSATTVSFERFC